METNAVKKLLDSIECLKRCEVRNLVDARIREFREIRRKPDSEIFKELCFCILAANFNAERAVKIETEIDEGFLTLPELELAKKLKEICYRFPNSRARYIVEARGYKDSLKNILETFNDENELREWLAKNVLGIGYKEASHFLRNIGYIDSAILDFHIINRLAGYRLIEKPKTLTKKRYLEIENLLREIARKANLTLAELDLYLWYMETGKILK